MRISSNSDDPGYSLFCRHSVRRSQIKITLNGVEIRNAIIADDLERYVVCFRTEPDGKTLVQDGDKIATEKLFGRVEIALPKPNTVAEHFQEWCWRNGVTVNDDDFTSSLDLAIENAVRENGGTMKS